MTDSRTRLLGLLGDPVEHSLSPRLHSFLIARAGLNYCYLAFRVSEGSLGEALSGMRALGIRGFNVTIPHKEAVIPFLDELSPAAEAIGAVNVIVNEDGRLRGDNTDWEGFLKALDSRGVGLCGQKAVVVGAGGAAAAVVYALLSTNVEVVVVNRTPPRAQALARRFSSLGSVTHGSLHDLAAFLREAELLVNATPVGMIPHVGKSPVPAHLLREGLVVYDLVYNPPETKLLRDARERRCVAIGGLEMLVHQGIRALELWTGHRFGDEDAASAIKHLEGVLRG
jgi:shikimate dehydrogenase